MSESMAGYHALTAFLADAETKKVGSGTLAVTVQSRQTFINIRGDNTDTRFHDAVKKTTGTALPGAANTVSNGSCSIYWIGPDECLLRSGADDDLENRLHQALSGLKASCTDLSHGYVMFSMSGHDCVNLLAKGCTLDLRNRSFAKRACAQSAISKASVLICRTGPGNWDVIVRRTFAEYLALWMRHAGREFGVTFDLA